MRQSAAIRPSREKRIRHRWVVRPLDVEKLQRHDIIITRQKSFISAGISLFSYGFPAHCDWFMDDGEDAIIGATLPRCRRASIWDYIAQEKEDTVRLSAVRIRPELIELVGEDVWGEVDSLVYNSLGKKYGWRKIADLGLYSFLTLGFLARGEKYLRVLNDKIETPICSELIERCSYPISRRIREMGLIGHRFPNGIVVQEDLFPSQLLPYASPFDIFDSWATITVSGCEHEAYIVGGTRA